MRTSIDEEGGTGGKICRKLISKKGYATNAFSMRRFCFDSYSGYKKYYIYPFFERANSLV
jgi:hypothetical protein